MSSYYFFFSDEKALSPDSVEYGEIPLLVDVAGVVLVRVYDFAAGVPRRQPPTRSLRHLTSISEPSTAPLPASAPSIPSSVPAGTSALTPLGSPFQEQPTISTSGRADVSSDDAASQLAFLQAQIAQLQAQMTSQQSSVRGDSSFEGYVVTKEGHPEQEEMPEITLRSLLRSNLARERPQEQCTYRGEIGGHPSQGINSSRFYQSLKQPPSNRPRSSLHPTSSRIALSAGRSASDPTAPATITATAPSRRTASQPSASKENAQYRPGGLYYEQRYARDGVAGPSREVYRKEN